MKKPSQGGRRTAGIAVALLLGLLLALSSGAEARRLKVGVTGSAPFVIAQDGQVDGLSVDVWKAVASLLNLQYEFVPIDTAQSGLDALRDGEVDALIGKITIGAERARSVNPSQPYFRASLGVMALSRGGTLLDRLRPFLNRALIAALVGVVLLVGIVGVLFWIVERHHHECRFPKEIVGGVADGMWLALTTMSTVGYGDRYPVTPAGRLVAGIWILLSMGLVSALTAAFTSALTLSQIGAPGATNAENLGGRRVAAVRGSTGMRFALQHQAQVLPVDHLSEGVALLRGNRVDAVVDDRSVLLYYQRQHPEEGLVVGPAHYQPHTLVIALPLTSNLTHSVNVALLQMAEDGTLGRLISEWLPEGD